MTTYTTLTFGDEGRNGVLRGAKALADAVRITLGPKARSVLIGKRWGTPLVCDDGVTIARAVRLEDPREDLGVQMLRQAAVRTGDVVGDGTTTSTLLAHTMFADGYPILVANTASLDELNERLAARGHAPLPMNRFRPNVVIDGLDPFDEDHVGTIGVGGVVLRLVKPCTRCRVTTTDQATARVGVEPLPTLGEFRMDRKLDGVTFGVNAVVVEGEGRPMATGAPAAIEYRF